MKKKFLASALAVLMIAAAAAVPAHADVDDDTNVILKYTPVLDGYVDAAYLQSAHTSKSWTIADYNARPDHFWGVGDFEFVDGITAYDWDCSVNSYLLWDDDYIYVAIVVNDKDWAPITQEQYDYAVTDSPALPGWQDSVMPVFAFEGLTFDIRADAAGRFMASEEASLGQCWVDVSGWAAHQENRDNFVTVSNPGVGYTVEMRLPVSDWIKDDILFDGGYFTYGLNVIDTRYGEHDGPNFDPEELKKEPDPEIGVNNINISNWMVLCTYRGIYANPELELKLSAEAPDLSNVSETDTPVVPDPAPNTSDAGIAFAAVALAVAGCFVFAKKKSR